MRNLLLSLSFLLPTMFFSQNLTEENLSVTMELSSIVEINQLSQYRIKIANTENVILNYCDKYIFVPTGFHLLVVDINQNCHLVVAMSYFTNLESQTNGIRIIPKGMQTIDYYSGQIIRVEDYIEYTICNGILNRY